jgi:hypothetical protein
MVMHRRTKAALQILSGLIVMAGGVWLADATLAPQTFHERVLPRTFQNGDVFYIVPCTGGGGGFLRRGVDIGLPARR